MGPFGIEVGPDLEVSGSPNAHLALQRSHVHSLEALNLSVPHTFGTGREVVAADLHTLCVAANDAVVVVLSHGRMLILEGESSGKGFVGRHHVVRRRTHRELLARLGK